MAEPRRVHLLERYTTVRLTGEVWLSICGRYQRAVGNYDPFVRKRMTSAVTCRDCINRYQRARR